jgi:hypothetical protein
MGAREGPVICVVCCRREICRLNAGVQGTGNCSTLVRHSGTGGGHNTVQSSAELFAASAQLCTSSLKQFGSTQISALLGYYATYIGSLLPTFRDNLPVPSSRFRRYKKVFKSKNVQIWIFKIVTFGLRTIVVMLNDSKRLQNPNVTYTASLIYIYIWHFVRSRTIITFLPWILCLCTVHVMMNGRNMWCIHNYQIQGVSDGKRGVV